MIFELEESGVQTARIETEDDYRRADAALNAMPAGDTPGSRSGVAKYDVAMRMATQRQT